MRAVLYDLQHVGTAGASRERFARCCFDA